MENKRNRPVSKYQYAMWVMVFAVMDFSSINAVIRHYPKFAESNLSLAMFIIGVTGALFFSGLVIFYMWKTYKAIVGGSDGGT